MGAKSCETSNTYAPHLDNCDCFSKPVIVKRLDSWIWNPCGFCRQSPTGYCPDHEWIRYEWIIRHRLEAINDEYQKLIDVLSPINNEEKNEAGRVLAHQRAQKVEALGLEP